MIGKYGKLVFALYFIFYKSLILQKTFSDGILDFVTNPTYQEKEDSTVLRDSIQVVMITTHTKEIPRVIRYVILKQTNIKPIYYSDFIPSIVGEGPPGYDFRNDEDIDLESKGKYTSVSFLTLNLS